MESDIVFVSGVDAVTGDYLQKPLTDQELVSRILREQRDLQSERELKWWHEYRSRRTVTRGLPVAIDSSDFSSAGWGVVFLKEAAPEVRIALAPLLERRRMQAGELYRELFYRRGESHLDFLSRNGAIPGAVDPEVIPYYLLIVGAPDEIPLGFQTGLGIRHAVGRLSFCQLEDYGIYAQSVIANEPGGPPQRKVSIVTATPPGDRVSALSELHFAKPLCESLIQASSSWEVRLFDKTTKNIMTEIIGGSMTPGLLFISSQGVAFPFGDPRRRQLQGAILCQDWPGPGTGPIRPEHYWSAADIPPHARLSGLIIVHHGDYSVATPRPFEVGISDTSARFSTKTFLAPLAQRLLSHPGGGALSVLGYVGQLWSRTTWRQSELTTLEATMKSIMAGEAIGHAMRNTSWRYASLASELSYELDAIKSEGKDKATSRRISDLWRAINDAKNILLLGDPAVRLDLGAIGTTASV